MISSYHRIINPEFCWTKYWVWNFYSHFCTLYKKLILYDLKDQVFVFHFDHLSQIFTNFLQKKVSVHIAHQCRLGAVTKFNAVTAPYTLYIKPFYFLHFSLRMCTFILQKAYILSMSYSISMVEMFNLING